MPRPPRPDRARPAPPEGGGERIAKVLARAGVASRREAEAMILAGRVSVNGRRIEGPALNVGPRDRVEVDGRPLAAPEPPRLWLYHKPAGLVTSARDEKGRATVFDRLPEGMPRVMPVGRLDLTSEGLLLLTNDGGLKRRLELPATGWLRRYRVRVKGTPDEAQLAPLRQGIEVEGERFQPMQVTLDRQQGANAWLTVGIREGRNREVRRAMEAVGLIVNRLIRTGYGPFKLGDLAPGAVEEVRPRVLRDQLGLEGLPEPAPEAPVRRPPTPGGARRGRPASDSAAAPAARTPRSRGGKDYARGAGGKAAAEASGGGAGKPAAAMPRSWRSKTHGGSDGETRTDRVAGKGGGSARRAGQTARSWGSKTDGGGTERTAKGGAAGRAGVVRGRAGGAASAAPKAPRSWGSKTHGGRTEGSASRAAASGAGVVGGKAGGAAGGAPKSPRSWGSKSHGGEDGGMAARGRAGKEGASAGKARAATTGDKAGRAGGAVTGGAGKAGGATGGKPGRAGGAASVAAGGKAGGGAVPRSRGMQGRQGSGTPRKPRGTVPRG